MGIWIGILVIVGFAVGFVLPQLVPAIRDRIAEKAEKGLTAKQEIELRKLLASPVREDGSTMTTAELSDRICTILDIELVIPPAAARDQS